MCSSQIILTRTPQLDGDPGLRITALQIQVTNPAVPLHLLQMHLGLTFRAIRDAAVFEIRPAIEAVLVVEPRVARTHVGDGVAVAGGGGGAPVAAAAAFQVDVGRVYRRHFTYPGQKWCR